MEEKITTLKKEIYSNLTPWQKVQVARHPDRPYTIDYINEISIWFIIIAISAVGIKTNLQEFSKVSFSYSVILILETLFLLISALVLINVLDI